MTNADIIKTFRAINENNTNEKTVKEYNIFLLNGSENRLVKELLNYDSTPSAASFSNEYTHTPEIEDSFIYILKSNDKEKTYGFAIFLLDSNNNKCHLYDYGFIPEYSGSRVELYFLKIIFNNLKVNGLNEIELISDITNPPSIELYSEELGLNIKSSYTNKLLNKYDNYIMKLTIGNGISNIVPNILC